MFGRNIWRRSNFTFDHVLVTFGHGMKQEAMPVAQARVSPIVRIAVLSGALSCSTRGPYSVYSRSESLKSNAKRMSVFGRALIRSIQTPAFVTVSSLSMYQSRFGSFQLLYSAVRLYGLALRDFWLEVQLSTPNEAPKVTLSFT